ncbi:MAG: SCO family protein [Steroidobacteraceae bacterium]
MSAATDRGAGRRQLLLLASVFLIPVVAAAWLYFSSGWRPEAGTHGELIDPPRPLAAEVLRGYWFLVYLPTGGCDDRCVAVMAELARVRLALDKDAARVRRVLLHAGDCCRPESLATEPDLLVLGATGPRGEALRALFPAAADGARIYIVDPHGNLMLSYPATGSARDLLKDLERLLRLSRIG